MAISNTSALIEGQTSLLLCIGWGRPSVEITWALNDQNVALNSSLISVSEEDIVQGERLFKQSVLKICSTEVADAGTYTCIVSNNDTSTNSTTELTVFGMLRERERAGGKPILQLASGANDERLNWSQ